MDAAAFVTIRQSRSKATLDGEPKGTGPLARTRRHEAHAAIAAVAQEHHRELCRRTAAMTPLRARAYLGLVHGIRELICDALDNPGAGRLTDLAPDILTWVAATFGSAPVGARA